MVVYSFYVFDRHGIIYSGHYSKELLTAHLAQCIYKKRWAPQPISSKGIQPNGLPEGQPRSKALSAEDDAKLVFGTVFSLRNMVRKLGGLEDK